VRRDFHRLTRYCGNRFVDVQGGSTIAPGNTGGTLTIDCDLQLDANSTYECEVEGLIAVAGDLDIRPVT